MNAILAATNINSVEKGKVTARSTLEAHDLSIVVRSFYFIYDPFGRSE